MSVEDSAVSTPGRSLELLERSEQLRVLDDSLAAVLSAGQGDWCCCEARRGLARPRSCGGSALARRPPGRILWGACEALFTPRALGPFVDVAQPVGGELEELVERGGRPHEVLSALAREVATASPTVLVLEDLHWADEATLDVLRLLGRRIDGIRALVLATYRDDELDALTPCVSCLVSSRGPEGSSVWS